MTTEAPINLRVDTSEFDAAMREMSANAETFGRVFAGALRQGALAGKDLDDILRGISLRIADIALNKALAPLENALAGMLGDLAGALGQRSTGGSQPRPANIVFNVNSSDASGFQRSEAQISGMLARAVARGNRTL